MFEKLVVVTRKTRLAQLLERWGSRGQARYAIERTGGDFADYQREDDTYRGALATIDRGLDELGLKQQHLERAVVPTYLFAPSDLIVTVGQDGLVANVAKYVGDQPVVAVNPDPARFDGVLLPFAVEQARTAVARVLGGRARTRAVTLAEARLGDGQRLLAFNDLFVGARSHVSARYAIAVGGQPEVQSSSGVLIATGAGSTGWLSSMFTMARGLAAFAGGSVGPAPSLGWDDPRLAYVVREPYVSKASHATVVAGLLPAGASLTIESHMPEGGVIFSDGVERDALAFPSGARVTIAAAAQRTRLVVG
ncbi:MAG: NAD(+)/NADH kinase [Myxococcales bacterium]|nr:NAD(+)/NADH kinase [Myxococcales bacterium]